MKKLLLATTNTTMLGLVFMLSSGEARAATSKIADTNTLVPASNENFTQFFPPAIKSGNVAFEGIDSSGQQGIYTSVGGSLNIVANQNTAVPGGTGNFNLLFPPATSGGNVAFTGGDSFTPQGIYTNIGGSLSVVANQNTAIPGGTGNFSSFFSPAIGGGQVVFEGADSSGQQGIYTTGGGSLNVVANQNTAVPGGTGNFTSLSGISFEEGVVTFKGAGLSGQQGIYNNSGGSLNVVANQNTSIPGDTGKFTSFSSATFDEGNVAFGGVDSSGKQGIYTKIGGSLNVVANQDTAIPGGKGNFTALSSPLINGQDVTFLGSGADGQDGIYSEIGGSLTKVIDLSNSLDGKTLTSLDLRDDLGVGSNSVVFLANFTDGSSGIFRTDLNSVAVPENFSGLGLLGFVALGTGSVLKRKRK